ncbi:MAG: STAS domain-containing protein [Bacteroidaceae bacterium]|jgi:anti-sigma B factor antagonist|nr:STAS domain-containing protein [Bacteroidaceae bacterium]
MKTTIQEENNYQVIYFEGRLDTSASSQVQQEVQPIIDDIKSDIILDCTKLDYISSSGLRIFLSILKSAKPLGKHVYIQGLSNDLRQVFTMTGFINLFEFK